MDRSQQGAGRRPPERQSNSKPGRARAGGVSGSLFRGRVPLVVLVVLVALPEQPEGEQDEPDDERDFDRQTRRGMKKNDPSFQRAKPTRPTAASCRTGLDMGGSMARGTGSLRGKASGGVAALAPVPRHPDEVQELPRLFSEINLPLVELAQLEGEAQLGTEVVALGRDLERPGEGPHGLVVCPM